MLRFSQMAELHHIKSIDSLTSSVEAALQTNYRLIHEWYMSLEGCVGLGVGSILVAGHIDLAAHKASKNCR